MRLAELMMDSAVAIGAQRQEHGNGGRRRRPGSPIQSRKRRLIAERIRTAQFRLTAELQSLTIKCELLTR